MYLKKHVLCLSCVLLALAKSVYADADYSDFETEFLAGREDAELTGAEKATLQKYHNWENGKTRSLQKSYIGNDGGIVYTYGAQVPSVVCAVLQICDIELEAGETINTINVGDQSRWAIEPAVTGDGSAAVEHVIVKPLDAGLETSMLITTDRRSYRIKLKSTLKEYMPHISFSYPEKLLAEFKAKQRAQLADREHKSITTNEEGSKTYLGDLNFNYAVDGDVSWKPVRIYDDGVKTIIEMPETILSRTAPSLLILEKEGGIFTDEKLGIINYRLQGTRYVVDGLFDQAVLTMDVGSDQQRVVIERKE